MFIGFEPISSLNFRRALPYSPQARGPVMFGESYLMKTTTLLGALAYLGWLRDENCTKEGTVDEPFVGVSSCLKTLGIESLRGPFALKGSNVYFGEDKLYPLLNVLELWKRLKDEGIASELLKGKTVLPRKKKSVWEVYGKEEDLFKKAISYGIALERDKKAIKEGYLYIKERVFPRDKIVMGFFATGNLSLSMGAYPFGKGGTARVVEIKKELEDFLDLNGKSEEGLLLFLTPTILLKPSEKIEDITVERIKDVIENDLGCGVEEVKPFPLLRRFEITLYPLGWDLVRDIQRPHVPAIVPGSAVYVKCRGPLSAGVYGLGDYSYLGFGTALFSP